MTTKFRCSVYMLCYVSQCTKLYNFQLHLHCFIVPHDLVRSQLDQDTGGLQRGDTFDKQLWLSYHNMSCHILSTLCIYRAQRVCGLQHLWWKIPVLHTNIVPCLTQIPPGPGQSQIYWSMVGCVLWGYYTFTLNKIKLGYKNRCSPNLLAGPTGDVWRRGCWVRLWCKHVMEMIALHAVQVPINI